MLDPVFDPALILQSDHLRFKRLTLKDGLELFLVCSEEDDVSSTDNFTVGLTVFFEIADDEDDSDTVLEVPLDRMMAASDMPKDLTIPARAFFEQTMPEIAGYLLHKLFKQLKFVYEPDYGEVRVICEFINGVEFNAQIKREDWEKVFDVKASAKYAD